MPTGPAAGRRGFTRIIGQRKSRNARALWAKVQATKGKPVKDVDAKPGTEWLKPGLIGRVRHLKGEEKLRHATLQEVAE
jgi:hypothetical protein